MGEPAIRVEKLSKRYSIGARLAPYATLRDTLAGALAAPFRRAAAVMRGGVARAGEQSIWALREVSFEIKPGEAVGVIGPNGAGKTTLLKVLARITEPTEGRVEIRGRVASLIDIGAGFHPELTGRENVFLSGAILGLGKAGIARRFDQIVDFAEIARFLDTPVKHYSSGMYLRLAFAVAAHLEPEILLVDEVLSVGDAGFQAKSLARMRALFGQGRTVLLVSHNLQAVQGLCRRVLYLERGRLAADGPPAPVLEGYLRARFPEEQPPVSDDPSRAPGNERIRIRSIRVEDADGAPRPLTVGRPARIVCEYWNMTPDTALTLVLSLYTSDGTPVLVSLSTTDAAWSGKAFPAGLYRSVCRLPGELLNDGHYRVRVLFVDASMQHLLNLPEAAHFEVRDTQPREAPWYGKFIGVVRPRLAWSTERLEPAAVSQAARPLPRVLLLADRRDWAFDVSARCLARALAGRFEFRIRYVEDEPDLGAWPFDLIYVFYYGETHHLKHVRDPARIMKCVTSHRWASGGAWGRLTPDEFARRHLSDAGVVTVTSRKLHDLLSPHRPVLRVRNGVDARDFAPPPERSGPVRFGWAGNESDPAKGLDILRRAAGGEFPLAVAGGAIPHENMGAFYKDIDVLCIASAAEGEPLPLLEGMAAGCFVVATDVGIVPEVIRDGENGLIVPRDAGSFRRALRRCNQNPQQVRSAGRANAELIRRQWTWEHCAPTYGDAFCQALAKIPAATQARA